MGADQCGRAGGPWQARRRARTWPVGTGVPWTPSSRRRWNTPGGHLESPGIGLPAALSATLNFTAMAR